MQRQQTRETRILFVLGKFQGYRIDLILQSICEQKQNIQLKISIFGLCAYDLHKPLNKLEPTITKKKIVV